MIGTEQRWRMSSLSATIKLSTFSKLCSAEAAVEDRIRKQRQARLGRIGVDTVAMGSTFLLANPRLPRRWTDEPL
jgi:hypothetical protein